MDSDVINDAKPAEYFANPPYRAELFHNNIAGVMNKNNINCLTFKSKTACTPYAAALHVSINPSALYRAIEVRNAQVKCKHCGSIIRKVKAD